jgi:hypothetical protein
VHLNPYDRGKIPGSVLKLEEVNLDSEGNQRQLWCYAISAKRYCLYTVDEHGEPELVKWSKHGLGHLLNPTDPDSEDRDWMRQVWEGLLRRELGLRHQWPQWLDRPALSRLTISSPELLKPFASLNAGKHWPDQVKPFNFLLVGHVRPFGHPVGIDPARFQLVAPYESNSTKWLQLPWINQYSGKRIAVSTTAELDGPDRARLQTFRDVIREFRTHPEAKSAGWNGRPCGRGTVGLLRRRVVQETYVAHVGKEANKFEEVEAGLEQNPEVIYTEYRRPDRDEWTVAVLPRLREQNLAAFARACGVHERSLYSLVTGVSRPRKATIARILTALESR